MNFIFIVALFGIDGGKFNFFFAVVIAVIAIARDQSQDVHRTMKEYLSKNIKGKRKRNAKTKNME